MNDAPLPFRLLFANPWLFVALIMLVNVVLWRRRIAALVRDGRLTAAEASRLVRALATGFLVPIGLLAVLEQVSGWPSPFCAYAEWRSPVGLAYGAITAAAWTVALWWTWRAGGAELMAKASPALTRGGGMRGEYSAAQVRWGVTLLILAAAVGGTAAAASIPIADLCR